MQWINVNTQLPQDGQEIYYFSPILGVWRGKYAYSPSTHSVWYDDDGNEHREEMSEELKARISPHVFYSGAGNCDTDEVTHWRPYDAKAAEQGWIPLPPKHGITEERMAEYREFHDDGEEEFVRENKAVIRQMTTKSAVTACATCVGDGEVLAEMGLGVAKCPTCSGTGGGA